MKLRIVEIVCPCCDGGPGWKRAMQKLLHRRERRRAKAACREVLEDRDAERSEAKGRREHA